MNKYKRSNRQDTSGFQRNNAEDESILEQQIREYETIIEQPIDKTRVQEQKTQKLEAELPAPQEDEEKEIIKVSKKHKKRLALIGTMVLLLAAGSMLYQFIQARGVLDYPIYYLNSNDSMVIHENTGTAKELSHFKASSDEIFLYGTFIYESQCTARISKNGEYCMYPEQIQEVDSRIQYNLMIREVGKNKASVVAKGICYYEEVAENYIVTYKRNESMFTSELYDLKTQQKIPFGSGNSRVFQVSVSLKAGMVVWLEIDQEDRVSLYYQKLDQSEEAVCVVDKAESCQYNVNEEFSFLYYTNGNQVCRIDNDGTSIVIAEDMSINDAIKVGIDGEVYLMRRKKFQPFDYIEMDTPLSSELMSSISNFDYGQYCYELYYYTPNVGLSLVTDCYVVAMNDSTRLYQVESPILIYQINKLNQRGKMLASSITKATDLFNWIYDEEYNENKIEVCYEGRVLITDKSIDYIGSNLKERSIFYVENENDSNRIDGGGECKLKRIDIDLKNKEETVLESAMGEILGFAEGKPYYYLVGDFPRVHQDVLYEDKVVLRDVQLSSVYYNQKKNVFVGIREYEEVLGSGTLVEVDQEGNETVLLEEVSTYAVIDEERMLIITKDKYMEETMYLYQKGKMRLLDQGRFKVLSNMEWNWDARNQ